MDPPANSWDRCPEAFHPGANSRRSIPWISQEGHGELVEKGFLSSQRGGQKSQKAAQGQLQTLAVLMNDAAAGGQGECTGGGQRQVDTRAPGRQG